MKTDGHHDEDDDNDDDERCRSYTPPAYVYVGDRSAAAAEAAEAEALNAVVIGGCR